MLRKAHVRKMLVDGSQWACWDGYHIPVNEPYFVIWTPIGTEMSWRTGTWTAKKHQLTYFWKDEWYVLHIGYTEDGEFYSGYCDVVLPTADYSNIASELLYTDLYIDVVIREDFSVYTKDQEVFDRAAKTYPIVEQAREKAFEVLDWLEGNAQEWTGPFVHIPKRLVRRDFEELSSEEAGEILQRLHLMK